MADMCAKTNEGQSKKAWLKPELEILDIQNTEATGHWEFQWNGTFWQNVWVEDNPVGFS